MLCGILLRKTKYCNQCGLVTGAYGGFCVLERDEVLSGAGIWMCGKRMWLLERERLAALFSVLRNRKVISQQRDVGLCQILCMPLLYASIEEFLIHGSKRNIMQRRLQARCMLFQVLNQHSQIYWLMREREIRRVLGDLLL